MRKSACDSLARIVDNEITTTTTIRINHFIIKTRAFRRRRRRCRYASQSRDSWQRLGAIQRKRAHTRSLVGTRKTNLFVLIKTFPEAQRLQHANHLWQRCVRSLELVHGMGLHICIYIYIHRHRHFGLYRPVRQNFGSLAFGAYERLSFPLPLLCLYSDFSKRQHKIVYSTASPAASMVLARNVRAPKTVVLHKRTSCTNHGHHHHYNRMQHVQQRRVCTPNVRQTGGHARARRKELCFRAVAFAIFAVCRCRRRRRRRLFCSGGSGCPQFTVGKHHTNELL